MAKNASRQRGENEEQTICLFICFHLWNKFPHEVCEHCLENRSISGGPLQRFIRKINIKLKSGLVYSILLQRLKEIFTIINLNIQRDKKNRL